MSLIFADTSAVVKRYIQEVGSTWVRTWIGPQSGTSIVVSELAMVEVVAALARRQRESALPPRGLMQLRDDFSLHAEQEYLVVSLRTPILLAARDLTLQHQLRTLDALQLASAVAARRQIGATLTFISADTRLLAVAAAEGFPTDNPNAH